MAEPFEFVVGTSRDLTETIYRRGTAEEATGVFLSTDAIYTELWAGDGQSPLATPATVWVDADIPRFRISFANADTASLAPGTYQVRTYVVRGDQTVMVFEGLVTLTPRAKSPAATWRALAGLSDCGTFLSTLDPERLEVLPPALEAATRAIESACGRPLVLTDFDRIYRPGRTRRIRLATRPVAELSRIKTDLKTVATITANASLNQVANVQFIPKSLTDASLGSLVLRRITYGAPTVDTLDMADYPLIADLVEAVNNLGGGWSCTGVDEFLSYPVAEINADMGTCGARGQAVELHVYHRDIMRYDLDPITGEIELTENLPQAYRYADRAYGIGYGWSWSAAAEPRHAGVRVVYRAGYAVAPADLALGYEPVPEDLRAACVATAQSLLEGVKTSGPLQSQTVKDRSYTLRDDVAAIPKLVLPTVLRYANKGLF